MKTAIAFLAAVFMAVFTAQGLAQSAPRAPVCMPLEKWQSGLKQKYGETPVFSGVSRTYGFLLFANRETGTWTILAVMPDRVCMSGAGNRFAQIP